MIGAQLNVIEGRHSLARRIFFGNLGELRQAYQPGMEDQLSALGLGLNCVVWWNTLYIDAAVKKLQTDGIVIPEVIRARIPPLRFDHIKFPRALPDDSPRPGRRTAAAARPEHPRRMTRRPITVVVSQIAYTATGWSILFDRTGRPVSSGHHTDTTSISWIHRPARTKQGVDYCADPIANPPLFP